MSSSGGLLEAFGRVARGSSGGPSACGGLSGVSGAFSAGTGERWSVRGRVIDASGSEIEEWGPRVVSLLGRFGAAGEPTGTVGLWFERAGRLNGALGGASGAAGRRVRATGGAIGTRGERINESGELREMSGRRMNARGGPSQA